MLNNLLIQQYYSFIQQYWVATYNAAKTNIMVAFANSGIQFLTVQVENEDTVTNQTICDAEEAAKQNYITEFKGNRAGVATDEELAAALSTYQTARIARRAVLPNHEWLIEAVNSYADNVLNGFKLQYEKRKEAEYKAYVIAAQDLSDIAADFADKLPKYIEMVEQEQDTIDSTGIAPKTYQDIVDASQYSYDGTYSDSINHISPEGNIYGQIKVVKEVTHLYWWAGTTWLEIPDTLDQCATVSLLPDGEEFGVIFRIPLTTTTYSYYLSKGDDTWELMNEYWGIDGIENLPALGYRVGDYHKVIERGVPSQWDGYEWVRLRLSTLLDDVGVTGRFSTIESHGQIIEDGHNKLLDSYLGSTTTGDEDLDAAATANNQRIVLLSETAQSLSDLSGVVSSLNNAAWITYTEAQEIQRRLTAIELDSENLIAVAESMTQFDFSMLIMGLNMTLATLQSVLASWLNVNNNYPLLITGTISTRLNVANAIEQVSNTYASLYSSMQGYLSSGFSELSGQVSQLDEDLTDLGTDLTNYFIDTYINYNEAVELDKSLKRVQNESTDIVAIAQGLINSYPTACAAASFTQTDVNNYKMALGGGISPYNVGIANALSSYLVYKTVDGVTYIDYDAYDMPIGKSIPPTQRNVIVTKFNDVEKYKSTLINKTTLAKQKIAETTAAGYTDGEITALNNTVTDYFSDTQISSIEASSLKTAYNQVVSESVSVLTAGEALLGAYHVAYTNYTGALDDLDTAVLPFIDQASYPILNVTTGQRDAITSAFSNCQSYKSALIKATNDKRDLNAQDYIEQQVAALESALSSLMVDWGNISINLEVSEGESTTLDTRKDAIDAETEDIILIAESIGILAPIIDKDLTLPPVTPTAGDRHIVASPSTGDWLGQEDKIAEYSGSAWVFSTPQVGSYLYVTDESKVYTINDSGWAEHTTITTDVYSDFADAITALSALLATYIGQLSYPIVIDSTDISDMNDAINLAKSKKTLIESAISTQRINILITPFTSDLDSLRSYVNNAASNNLLLTVTDANSIEREWISIDKGYDAIIAMCGPAPKIDVDTAVLTAKHDALESELNTVWLGMVYPKEVTQQNKDDLATALEEYATARTDISVAITAKQATNSAATSIGEFRLNTYNGFIKGFTPDLQLFRAGPEELRLKPVAADADTDLIKVCAYACVHPYTAALNYTEDGGVITLSQPPVHVCVPDEIYYVYLANNTNENFKTDIFNYKGRLFLSEVAPTENYWRNDSDTTFDAILVGEVVTSSDVDGNIIFLDSESVVSLASSEGNSDETQREFSDFDLRFIDENTIALVRTYATYGQIFCSPQLYFIGEGKQVTTANQVVAVDPIDKSLSPDGAVLPSKLYYIYMGADSDIYNLNVTNTDVTPNRPLHPGESVTVDDVEISYDSTVDFRVDLFLSETAPTDGKLGKNYYGFHTRHVGQVNTDATGKFIYSIGISAIRQMTLNPKFFDGLAEIQLYTPTDGSVLKVIQKEGTSGLVMVGAKSVQTYTSSDATHTISPSSTVYVYDETAVVPLIDSELNISQYASHSVYLYIANDTSAWNGIVNPDDAENPIDLRNETFLCTQNPVSGYLSASWPGNNARYIATIQATPSGKGIELVTKGDFSTTDGWTVGEGWDYDAVNQNISHTPQLTVDVSDTQIACVNWLGLTSVTVNQSTPGDITASKIYHAVSFDGAVTYQIHKTDAWLSIVRDNAGTWQYLNSGSWADASSNTLTKAFEQATDQSGYRWEKTEIEAMNDAAWTAENGWSVSVTTVDWATRLVDGVNTGYVDDGSCTYATPDMTSATAPSGVVSGTGTTAWYAFNQEPGNNYLWLDQTLNYPCSLMYAFASTGKIVNKYRLQSRDYSSNRRFPKDWKLQGTDNVLAAVTDAETANGWTTIDEQTGISDPGQALWTPYFTCDNAYPYKKYRIRVTASNATDGVAISELMFVEATQVACSPTFTSASFAPTRTEFEFEALEQTSMTVLGNSVYEFSCTVESASAGSLIPVLGGERGTPIIGAGQQRQYILTSDTSPLSIIPTNTADHTIDAVSCKNITSFVFGGGSINNSIVGSSVTINDNVASFVTTYSSQQIESMYQNLVAMISAETVFTSEKTQGILLNFVQDSISQISYYPQGASIVVAFPDTPPPLLTITQDGVSSAVPARTSGPQYIWLSPSGISINTLPPDQEYVRLFTRDNLYVLLGVIINPLGNDSNLYVSILSSGETTAGQTVTASGYRDSNYLPWKAFNQSNVDQYDSWMAPDKRWSVSMDEPLAWIQVVLPESKVINKYAFQARSSADHSPTSWRLWGSNDNINYTCIDIRSQIPAPGTGVWSQYFYMNNSTAYRTYKMVIYSANQPEDYWVSIGELKFVEQDQDSLFSRYGSLSMSASRFITNGDGEFNPSFEYATVVATQDDMGTQVFSASSVDGSSYPAWNAFDRTVGYQNDAWMSNSTPTALTPESLMVDFGVGTVINKYIITTRNYTTSLCNPPSNWTIQGTNTEGCAASDAETANGWTTLDTQEIGDTPPITVLGPFCFTNTDAYRYYRMRITGVPIGYSKVAIGDLQLVAEPML